MDVPCDFPDMEVWHLKLDRTVWTPVRQCSGQKWLLRSPAHFFDLQLWVCETTSGQPHGRVWIRGGKCRPLSSGTCSGGSGAEQLKRLERSALEPQRRRNVVGISWNCGWIFSKNSSMTPVDVDGYRKGSTCTTSPPYLKADLEPRAQRCFWKD